MSIFLKQRLSAAILRTYVSKIVTPFSIHFLLALTAISAQAQITFEPGYYINNSGDTTHCLIKNIDWKNNPENFKYTLTEKGEVLTAALENVKEFGLYNTVKYQRYMVEIDASSFYTSDKKAAEFATDTLFLKVLVEGAASLFSYTRGETQYFYNIDHSTPKQLLFKRYKTEAGVLGKNESFKQELWINLTCEKFTLERARKTEYSQKELIQYIVDFNECKNQPSAVFSRKKSARDAFNLSLRPGIKYSWLEVGDPVVYGYHADFPKELDFRFGIEAEVILPFNKNKWAITVEPTYQSFKSTVKSVQQVAVKYTSIEIPLGVRYSIFLKNKSKFFVNALLILDYSIDSYITYTSLDGFDNKEVIDIESASNFGIGAGYAFRKHFTLELRAMGDRALFVDDALTSQYRATSFIVGYKIL